MPRKPFFAIFIDVHCCNVQHCYVQRKYYTECIFFYNGAAVFYLLFQFSVGHFVCMSFCPVIQWTQEWSEPTDTLGSHFMLLLLSVPNIFLSFNTVFRNQKSVAVLCFLWCRKAQLARTCSNIFLSFNTVFRNQKSVAICASCGAAKPSWLELVPTFFCHSITHSTVVHNQKSCWTTYQS